MSEQTQPKKSHAVSNAALLGLLVLFVGGFLIWRASNMGSSSGFGFLLLLVGLAMLIGSGVTKLRQR